MRKLGIVALMLMATLSVGNVFGDEVAASELAAGAKAPGFSLVNAVDGQTVELKPDDGKLKVVVFTCIKCPYAKAFEPRLIELANRFTHKGANFYLVNPNDIPGESPADMKARASEQQYPFVYLKDADSSVARAYGARVTPHVFVVDGDGIVRYRGYIDDSAKPAERQVEGLSSALTSLLNGRDIARTETKAFGCTIKWKS